MSDRYRGICPYHHSLRDACTNPGTWPVINMYDDEAREIMVCESHYPLYVGGWVDAGSQVTDVEPEKQVRP